MANIEYESWSLSATTSSGPSGSGATTKTWNGYLSAVQYVPSTSAIPSTGGSVAFTGTRTGITLFSFENLGSTAAGVYFPRVATVTTTGATSTGAGLLPLFDETITVTLSSASTGGTKTGAFRFYVE